MDVWVDHSRHGDRHNEQQLNTVAQLRAFLNGTQEVQFEPRGEDTTKMFWLAGV